MDRPGYTVLRYYLHEGPYVVPETFTTRTVTVEEFLSSTESIPRFTTHGPRREGDGGDGVEKEDLDTHRAPRSV